MLTSRGSRPMQEQLSASAKGGGSKGSEASQKLAELEENYARLSEENTRLRHLYEGILRETQKVQGQAREATNGYQRKIDELEGAQREDHAKKKELQ